LPTTAELVGSTDVSLQMRSPEAVIAAAPLLAAHRLFDIELVPVCSPSLLRAGALDGDVSAIRDHMLLHSNARADDWAAWMQAAGLREADARRGIFFESSSLAYQAAVEGVGIAIGMKRLVEADLAAGRLVMPSSFVHRTNLAFHLLYAHSAAAHPPVAAFRDWVVSVGDSAGG
jgi:LysR family glycine cleavage system transcriptional activator